jgi:hypothetical protein
MTKNNHMDDAEVLTVPPFLKKTFIGIVLVSGALTLWPSHEMPVAQLLPQDSPLQLAKRWDELSPRERSRALDNYRRFQKLPPEKKRDLEDRYHRWQELPSDEQERIRQNYRRYRGMDSDEKEDFGRKYKHWRERPRD